MESLGAAFLYKKLQHTHAEGKTAHFTEEQHLYREVMFCP